MTIHFLKLSVPWNVMVYYAEELSLRAPLQVRTPNAPTPPRGPKGGGLSTSEQTSDSLFPFSAAEVAQSCLNIQAPASSSLL